MNARLERGAPALKRAIDLVGAAGALAVGWPALFTIALAIKMDSPGPALFKQARLGRGGRVFRIWKFRTMVEDAPVVIDENGSVRNDRDDDRHTRVGAGLRRFSLDELPQLVNVLLGDMSLVGPRPDLPEALEFYTEEERQKLLVKPGITGLSQVSGRNSLTPQERWHLDSVYARDASIGGDLRILVKTVTRVLGRTDVYKP